jgi:hypothetical protein
VLCAAAVLFAAACGEGDSSDGGDDSPTVELSVTLDVDGSGPEEPQQADVSCPGDDAGVCAEAEEIIPSDFDEVPASQACTEIFGGPDVATIEGEIDGEQVEGEFTRANGCEIDRFGNVVPLLQALFPDYQPGSAIGA